MKDLHLTPPGQSPALVEQVAEQLRLSILNGTLKPGELLPSEGELGERLRVSRTVAREAIRILRSQGLVEVSQGRRARVREPSHDSTSQSLDAMLRLGHNSLLDLAEIRRPLETEIVGLAAQRATPAQLDQLEVAVRDLEAATTPEAMVDADARFHSLLAEAAHNPLFPLFLQSVWSLLRESIKLTTVERGQHTAVAHHDAILHALRKRDADTARRIMREHLKNAEERLRRLAQAAIDDNDASQASATLANTAAQRAPPSTI